MIKYYDVEASSSSAKLENRNNTYEHKYRTNNSADISRYSEIIEDRYVTTYKPKEKKASKVYDRRTIGEKSNASSKDEIRKRMIERKKNISRIFDVIVCFSMLMLISYRYATIDANFRQKENLKKELASIQKENEQLKVNIEKQMNFNAIEQEAKEKLGMQKLDNNQKVYINLNKSDYIEPSENVSNTENKKEETWWCKLLKDLFKIDN